MMVFFFAFVLIYHVKCSWMIILCTSSISFIVHEDSGHFSWTPAGVHSEFQSQVFPRPKTKTRHVLFATKENEFIK